MTEQEWLSGAHPHPLLVFLRGPVPDRNSYNARIISSAGDLCPGPGERVSPRKMLLFIAVCSRRLLRLSLDGPSRTALEALGRYADGRADRHAFWDACMAIQQSRDQGAKPVVSHLAAAMWTEDPAGASTACGDVACTIANYVAKDSVAVTCADATEDDWFSWSFCGGPPDPLWQATKAAEEQELADLLREIVGNPFRTVAVCPAWLAWSDGAVPKVAEAAYEANAFDRLPLLADALEDAGCADADILTHLRGPGPHVRGCWALDILLAKG